MSLINIRGCVKFQERRWGDNKKLEIACQTTELFAKTCMFKTLHKTTDLDIIFCPKTKGKQKKV